MRSFLVRIPAVLLLLSVLYFAASFGSARNVAPGHTDEPPPPVADPAPALSRHRPPRPPSPSPASPEEIESDDARAELTELRDEMRALDATTGGRFSSTLREVLADPARSASIDGAYRLPAREGIDALLALLPPPGDAREDESNWAFIDAVSLIQSSAPGAEIDNYLALDAKRHVRSVLFLP